MDDLQPTPPNIVSEIPPEIKQAFDIWQALLEKWNARINLVSRGALKEKTDFWKRHALDSWQLWPLVPAAAKTVLDLGSGAGFPGIALAIGAKYEASRAGGPNPENPSKQAQKHITLVESAGKKANFLKTVIRELGLPASVWDGRLEDLEPRPYDIISARAFAPLPRLLSGAAPFWGPSTQALLLKGQSAAEELTKARESFQFDVTSHVSQTDPEGAILQITHLKTK